MTRPASALSRSPAPLREAAWWAPGLVALACALAYADSLRGAFVYDDTDSIVENPAIRAPLLSGGFLRSADGITVSGRPVLALSLALNHAVSGLDTWSYHVTNIAIHIGAALALLGILRRTAPRLGLGPADARLFGLAGALFWGLHPLQTEAVTYVVQRAESMAGFLFLLAVYAFIRSAGQGGGQAGAAALRRPAWEALAVLSCLLGVGTKEILAPAPLLILLYDRTFLSGSFSAALRLRWRIHAALAACWAPLLLLIRSGGWNRSGAIGPGVAVAPWTYWLTQPGAILRYLRLSLWPRPLVFEYGTFWTTWHQAWPQALAVAVLLALTAWALVRRPAAGFLGAWFFGILAPTSVMPGMTQIIVEHRMYLPLAAVAGALAFLLFRAFGRPGAWVLCAWAAGLGVLTARRNEVYRTELGVWLDTLGKVSDRAGPHFGAGYAYLHLGRMDEAMAEFGRACVLNPEDAPIRNNYGGMFVMKGDFVHGAEQYAASVRLKATDPMTWSNYGFALWKLGRETEARAAFSRALALRGDDARIRENFAVILATTGHLRESLPQFAQAVRLDPENAQYRAAYGENLLSAGLYDEGARQSAAAVRLDASLTIARLHEGLDLLALGRPAEALPWLEAAGRDPAHALRARLALGAAHVRLGRNAQAVADFEGVLGLDPGSVGAWRGKAEALEALGRLGEAETALQMWVRLAPDNPEGHGELGVVLRALGREDEAAAQFGQVRRIDPANPRACDDLGRVLTDLGRAGEAADAFAQEVRLRPRDGRARAELADALLRDGRAGQAVPEFEAALSLGADSAALRNNLGLGLQRLGRLTESIAQFEAALRLDPGMGLARENLARSQALRGAGP